MIPWLQHAQDPLPEPRFALPPGSEAPGLLAAGGELTPERLSEAYSRGIFPWYGVDQPVLWWSPDPRMVMFPAEFKLSHSLRKTIRKFIRTHDCEVRIDGNFRAVITACAGAPREGQVGTWIVPEMIEAYCRWHRLGATHSVETWIGGELAGGLYLVNRGRMVYGESMFARRTDASKIAFAALVCFCRAHGITLIDCQQRTGHLASLGGREIPRPEFETALAERVHGQAISDWTYHPQMWDLLEDPAASPTHLDPGP